MAITLVRKAVEARNDLVHLGSGSFDRPTLEVFLEVVGDLLYMLDFYRGQAWAVQRIKHASLVSAMREP